MSLQSRLAPLIAAIGADIKALKNDPGVAAFYQKTFAAMTPLDLVGGWKSHPDGAQTYILPTTGTYKVTFQDIVRHTGPYTYENTQWGITTTAGRLDVGGNLDSWLPSAGQDGNRTEAHVAYFSGIAGQNIQFIPWARMAAASGVVGSHTFAYNVTIELVGAKQGPKGDTGGLQWKQPWAAGTLYNVDDLVTYNDAIYRAKVANTGVAPSSDATKWDFILFGPNATQKNALPGRGPGISGPSWSMPGVGYNPPPGDLNRYLAESDRKALWWDLPSGGTLDFWPGDGYWLVKAYYGYHYDADMNGFASVYCARYTSDGATRHISIRDQYSPAINTTVVFSVVNNNSLTGVIRAVASHGNTRIMAIDLRPIMP